MKLALGRATVLGTLMTINNYSIKKKNTFEEISVMCRYYRLLMSFYGLQGGFRDFVVFNSDTRMESMLTVFCCVVFPFHYSISSCLHVHGNVPKCYPQILWVVLISLLCMKIKVTLGEMG